MQSQSRDAGQSITQLFAEQGEQKFRQLESEALAKVSADTNSVIATGGGIILRPKNWDYLRHGVTVWLDVPIEQLYARLQTDTTRPILQDADLLGRLRSLHKPGQPLYAQADLRVSVSDKETPSQLATRVLEKIEA